MHKVTTSIRDTILTAKRKLEDLGLTPKWVYLSPLANETLLNEVNRAEGRNHKMVLEVHGMVVRIDPDCPTGGAYIFGEAKENGKECAEAKTCENEKASKIN